MLIQSNGILKFDISNKTKKHESQSSWKKVAMIITNDDLCEYYSWFIQKRFNLFLNKPLRGSHITFINDRDIDIPNFDQISQIFNNKNIDFFIDPEPRSNGKHWWLRVYSPEIEIIRTLGGGSPEPFFSLHLTLGIANEKNLHHSEYILRQCKKFELISNEPRKSIENHKIIKFK